MSNPLTQDSYESKRMLHMQKKAGIHDLFDMSDEEVRQEYLSIYGEGHDESSGYDEERLGDGAVVMHTKVGNYWVHSISSPNNDFDVERLRHHICVDRYRRLLNT